VVAELGARHKGDVTLLCEIARPEVVVVTNVGVAHMEIFGSWDAIVEASAEPVEAVGSDGVAVLNADDPVVAGFAERCRGRVVTYGTGAGARVRAVDVSLDEQGCAEFSIVTDAERAHLRLAVPGEHMVSNGLAAATVGLELGISLDVAAEALARANVSRWRMESFTTQSGVKVLNDAYNANPESMAAALKTARWMAGDGRCIAVLGAMAELGPIADREHERVGELAARLRIDRVITVGQDAALIATAAEREGVEPENVAAYEEIDEALADVLAHAGAGDVVVCKASRVVGLERLAEALR
jgi:UDP-N-acetylmuramoyl-tripeptide--D-alanyl-D-alanine ligase